MDLRTILICSTLINIYLCVIMFVYYRSQKTYAGFNYWLACNFVLAAVYGPFALLSALPSELAILVVNSLIIAACILRIIGIRRFLAKIPPFQIHWILILIVFSYLGWFCLVHDEAVTRTIFISFLVVSYSYYIGYLIFKERHLGGGGLYIFAVNLFCFHASILIIRAWVLVMNPAGRTLYDPSFFNTIYFQLTLILDIGWTTTYIMLNSQRTNFELLSTRSQLEKIAYTDPLTGLLNRRRFYEEAEKEINTAKQTNQPLSLILFDFDDFKPINDNLGHTAGDRVLVEVAAMLLQSFRPSDKLVRLGGDEFVALLPQTSTEQAAEISKRLKYQLFDSPIEWKGSIITISLSMGIATLENTDTLIDHLVQRADTALYDIKNSDEKGHTIIKRLGE